jgi:hypothetical protein
MRIRTGTTGASGRDRMGHVLVLSLFAVITVALLMASFLQMASQNARHQAEATERKQAFYLAEAGLGEAYSGVLFGKTGKVGSRESPAIFGDGLLWVESTDIGDGALELKSYGMVGGETATLSLVVERGSLNIGSLGFFGAESLAIGDGVRIDAFDSSRPDTEESFVARVGSNDDITIHSSDEGSTSIEGDVTPGKDKTLILTGTPTITGSTESRRSEIELPDVKAPDLEEEPGITYDRPNPLRIRSGETRFEFIRILEDSDLLIRGPCTIVTDELYLAPGASVEFDSKFGEIQIFVEKKLELSSGSFVEHRGQDPSMLTINFLDDEPALLHAEGSFHGTVLSPKGLLDVGPAFEVFGAAIGKELNLAPGARLHFDHFLLKVGSEEAKPSFLSWRIVDFTDAVPGKRSRDPFRDLGVDRRTLLAPSKSHEDQFLEIEYYDKSGILRSYSGMESAFDWQDVATVVGGSRDGEYAALSGKDGLTMVK